VSEERIAQLPTRLSNLSWFMRCLHEPTSPRECQGSGQRAILARLLSLPAVAGRPHVAVRAGITETLAASDDTSIKQPVGYSPLRKH